MTWRFLLLLALVAGATATNDENLCQGCRKIVSFMETLNKTINHQQMATVLQHFCEQYYPPSTDFQQGPCPVFVQGLTYVISNTNPVTHCDEIDVCGPKLPSDDIYQYIEISNSISPLKSASDDKFICDYCEDVVNQLKTSLSDPDTVREVRERVDALCTYLKVVDFENECRHMADNYIDYVVNLIKSVDSRAYCSSIHMCPPRPVRAASSTTGQLPTLADFNNFGIETAVQIGPKPTAPASNRYLVGPGCTLCKTVVKEMFHFLHENKTEENIIKGLDQICQVVYPSEPKLGECKSMVKAYTREIVELLMDETDPEMICILLEQCVYSKTTEKPQQADRRLEVSTQNTPTVPEAPNQAYGLAQLITALDPSISVKSLRACVECKMFIKYLKGKLENHESQAQIKQWLLDNLCKELPEQSLIKSCSSMVESYSDVFFEAVAGDLNPQTACVQLGVCNAKAIVQVLNLSDPSSNTSPLAQPKLTGMRQLAMTKERRCARCTDVVSLMDDYLIAHPTREEIATVPKVCDTIDNLSIRGECLYIVERYGEEIVQSIPTMESPRHLCKQVALC